MSRSAIAALCGLVWVGVAAADVTVTGTGKVTYMPDLATVDVEFNADGDTTAAAWKKHAVLRKKLCDVAEGSGVAAKDIKTASVYVTPRYETKGGDSRVVGYRVVSHLDVTARDVEKVSRMLDSLQESEGAARVRVVFSSTALEKLLDEARTKAVADARRKAALFANAAGADLAGVSAIEELGDSLPGSGTFTYGGAGGKGGESVAPSEQQLSVRVRISYSLKGARVQFPPPRKE